MTTTDTTDESTEAAPEKDPVTAALLPGLHDNVDEHAYHSDKGSVSVSGLKQILKSPAHYRWAREHPTESDAFDLGTAVHTLVLGVGDPLVEIKADSWRTNAAKDAAKEARANHQVPLLTDDYQKAHDMAAAVDAHPLARQIFADPNCRPEVSAFCLDERTGVMRRGRFDWLAQTGIVDLKTTQDADPASFGRTAANLGYDMQAAFYLDLAADLGHPALWFWFVLIEKSPPYMVSVVELDEQALRRGRARCRAGLERFRDCVAADSWPGYQPDGLREIVSLPKWAFYGGGR